MISVDPGESCFNAQWSVGGYLVACGLYNGFENMTLTGETLVIEDQVIIKKFTKNPRDIIRLAHLAGDITHVFGGPNSPRVKWVEPRTWKQGTRKPKYARLWASYVIHRLVVEALDARELSIYTVALAALPEGQRHDLADAVGLGLWELGRLPRANTESPRRAARMAKLAETLKRQAS